MKRRPLYSIKYIRNFVETFINPNEQLSTLYSAINAEIDVVLALT